MQEIIELFLKHYATISVISSTLIGSIYFLRKWISNGIKSIKLSISFYEYFGDFPAKKIKEVHDAIVRSCNTLDLRQQIADTHIKIGVYICEVETGKCTWTNYFLNQLFEMDSIDMKGYGWGSAILNDDRINTLDIWRAAVKNRDPYYATYKIKGKISGKIKEVTTHAIAALDDDGQIICYVGYLYEINSINNN